ncbi:adhesion G protein-coupled receptor F4 [Xyrichtys novacula]|uniref:Adhesion G protein-coupled receptor F4 n=1 Tax=Xyrichtys novacula TaxID=13765 RepID=A0AAV1GTK1_XYRNO|nr:adhesion G protein-coupled receptor F4 [Xyrichtys novacula]
MRVRDLIFLTGTVYAFTTVNIYIAELMVESNITLEADTVLSALNKTSDLQVTDNNGDHTVTLMYNELVAECLIFGSDTFCNCSDTYTWSNEVCDTFNCCRDTSCDHNVTFTTPLCVPKAKVVINGSVILSASTWDPSKTTKLQTEFEALNAFEYLNVTGQRLSDSVADFEVVVNVKFLTSKLQTIVTSLENQLGAVLLVDTEGIVTIDAPEAPVCYESTAVLKCTLEEETDNSGWNMSREHERFGLNNGDVVKLDSSCWTDDLKSCVTVTLKEVTGIWAGTYECGFTTGSVRHTARSQLHVALLPDDIILKINPLSVDCSKEKSSETVQITAMILKSKELFEVRCAYRDKTKCDFQSKTEDKDHQLYTFEISVSCTKTTTPHFATVTFKNTKDQEKTAKVDIPVIYDGTTYCLEDVLDGEYWPKTPTDDTVINRTCLEGRTGYKSRTCKGTTWEPVFSYCINAELDKNLNAAENFLKGLGATREGAKNIFEHLKNNSFPSNSNLDYTTADVSASINILETMAKASENIVLHEEVLDDFMSSASSMLDITWSGVNESVSYTMSADYLLSVESLVKHIKINTSTGFSTQNLDLKFCKNSDCNVSVSDINVNLKNNNGLLKTLAVKNLMDRLRNNFDNTERTGLILSATLVNSNESVEIGLNFPRQLQNLSKGICVFWDTTGNVWSKAGCKAKTTKDNRILCVCTHLTAFSVLMAKGDVSNEVLDIITNVGLGVSISSLIIFLVIESVVWSAVVKTNLSLYRHTALVNIAVFLLLADCCFVASASPKDLSETMCLALTVCKHLFFLAMFSWMLCMSVMLVHRLIFVFSPLRKRVFMFLSSIVGYICPILIVGSSYVYCKYTGTDYVKLDTCWLVYDGILEGSIYAFVIPVGTVILTNIFSMVVVIVTLVKSSASEGSKTDDKETIKSILKVVVFLTPVFGVTWVIGFSMFILDDDDPLFEVANYSFTILNSFQGFFLLVTGCFAEQKVREELIKIIMKKSKGKSESMKNFTTATYGN